MASAAPRASLCGKLVCGSGILDSLHQRAAHEAGRRQPSTGAVAPDLKSGNYPLQFLYIGKMNVNIVPKI